MFYLYLLNKNKNNPNKIIITYYKIILKTNTYNKQYLILMVFLLPSTQKS